MSVRESDISQNSLRCVETIYLVSRKAVTQAEFRKSGWLKHFLQYDEAELATIVMLVSNLLETNCWEPTVNYCMCQMELAREEESSVPEDQIVH